jgi:hypothetical protein
MGKAIKTLVLGVVLITVAALWIAHLARQRTPAECDRGQRMVAATCEK